jgi:hypothetical protein
LSREPATAPAAPASSPGRLRPRRRSRSVPVASSRREESNGTRFARRRRPYAAASSVYFWVAAELVGGDAAPAIEIEGSGRLTVTWRCCGGLAAACGAATAADELAAEDGRGRRRGLRCGGRRPLMVAEIGSGSSGGARRRLRRRKTRRIQFSGSGARRLAAAVKRELKKILKII